MSMNLWNYEYQIMKQGWDETYHMNLCMPPKLILLRSFIKLFHKDYSSLIHVLYNSFENIKMQKINSGNLHSTVRRRDYLRLD